MDLRLPHFVSLTLCHCGALWQFTSWSRRKRRSYVKLWWWNGWWMHVLWATKTEVWQVSFVCSTTTMKIFTTSTLSIFPCFLPLSLFTDNTSSSTCSAIDTCFIPLTYYTRHNGLCDGLEQNKLREDKYRVLILIHDDEICFFCNDGTVAKHLVLHAPQLR